jgi:hypothetical protein
MPDPTSLPDSTCLDQLHEALSQGVEAVRTLWHRAQFYQHESLDNDDAAEQVPVVQKAVESLLRAQQTGRQLLSSADSFLLPARSKGPWTFEGCGVCAGSAHEAAYKLVNQVLTGPVLGAQWDATKGPNLEHYDPADFAVRVDAITADRPRAIYALLYAMLALSNGDFDRLKAEMKIERAAVLGALPKDDSGEKHDQPKTKATVAARMIDLMKDPATHTWTAEQFRQKLGCKSRSTITNTAAWRQLVVARESARLSKAQQAYDKNLDKRRRPKRKQRPDRLGD